VSLCSIREFEFFKVRHLSLHPPKGRTVELLMGRLKSRAFLGLFLLLILMLPVTVRADIYKCSKAGAISYQETPCEGANVQTTHMEDRGSGHFIGCFSTAGYRSGQIIEVRANGAGTYQLLDERDPMGPGTVLKQATHDEMVALGNGFHIKITDGLSRQTYQSDSVTVYTTRYGNRYFQRSAPVAQPVTSISLYGIYRAINSEGVPITLFYTGGTPQVVEKADCPTL
jgi:hypothetical protein